MFLNKQKSKFNIDMSDGRDLNYYLNLTKDYSHNNKFFVENINGFNVVDDSKFKYGTKARFADFMISKIKSDSLVYVAPRSGFAAYSLIYLAKKYNKKLFLFMPSSKEASKHQLRVIEEGATPIFLRTPAMPTLNSWAKKFAANTGSYYIPFGLKHELVTAGGVRIVHDCFKDQKVDNLWTVFSTGVLSRILQIAFHKTNFNSVAVARNVQDGELGSSKFYSYHKKFSAESHFECPFDCINTYDLKGWEYMNKYGKKGDWFWNVAGNMPEPTIKPSDINSERDWGDFSDMIKFL
jgi:hypothetical protein